MSYVIAAPDMLATAAADVAGIGSSLSEANTAAAASTTRVIAAADDEVSAAVASLFSSHGTAFQALSAQAAAFHAQFVQALNAGARAYASSEAANAGLLQTLAQALPVPNVSVSASGFTLLHLGTASTYSLFGGFAVAVGANSNASAIGLFNSAFALGAGSDATTDGEPIFGPKGIFDTAIAVGTNDVARAGAVVGGIELPEGFNGSFDTAFVVGTGSTAVAGATNLAAGNHDLAAVVNGDRLTATATGANFLVDIVTPFGTL